MGNAAWVVTDSGFEKAEIVYARAELPTPN